MSGNRANELSVNLREVFDDKIKVSFSENPKRLMTGVGLLSLAGGDYKHSHLKKTVWMPSPKLMKEEEK